MKIFFSGGLRQYQDTRTGSEPSRAQRFVIVMKVPADIYTLILYIYKRCLITWTHNKYPQLKKLYSLQWLKTVNLVWLSIEYIVTGSRETSPWNTYSISQTLPFWFWRLEEKNIIEYKTCILYIYNEKQFVFNSFLTPSFY